MRMALLMLLLLLPVHGIAQETDMRSVVSALPLTEFQQTVNDLSREGRTSVRDLLEKALRGESVFALESAGQTLKGLARDALLEKRSLLLSLFAPVLLAAVLGRFQAAWGQGGCAEAAQWICFLTVALAAAKQCRHAFALTRGVVAGAAAGARAFFPLLTTLLTALGGAGSAAVLQPAVTLACAGTVTVCEKICLPLTAAFFSLSVLDSLNDAWPLGRFAKLCRAAGAGVMGAALTAFTGMMTVRGFTAKARDGVALRAAKFAADTFVPEIGGMLSDTAETVAASSYLVKNALGVTGIALLCAYLAAPLVEILLSALIFRLAAAMSEPLGEGRMARCLDGASGAMGLLASCVLCTAAMFLVLAAQAVAAGGATVLPGGSP